MVVDGNREREWVWGVREFEKKYFESKRWTKNVKNIRIDSMCEVVTVSWKNNRFAELGRIVFRGVEDNL